MALDGVAVNDRRSRAGTITYAQDLPKYTGGHRAAVQIRAEVFLEVNPVILCMRK